MGGIRFCGCGGQSENPIVCFGTKPTQRACVWDFPWDRKRTRERRSQREQKKAESRTEQGGRQKRAGVRACGLRGRVGQSERMSQHSWWLCGNFAQIHARDSLQMHGELHKSASPFLRLELTQVCDCLFSFSSTLSVGFCVSVKNVKYPWPEMRETTRQSDGHEWFRRLRQWGLASSVLSHNE